MTDLLPPNAPKESRDRAAVMARLSEIDVPIRDMLNPWKCPAPFLPYLAWSFSVDHWNEDWDEQTQRRLIAASWDTHAHKGTPFAVEQAVEALGLSCELEEWFQNAQRQKGTFGVHVAVGPGTASLTPELQRDIDRAVTKAKRGSQHHDIRLDARFGTRQQFGTGATLTGTTRVAGAAAGRSALAANRGRATAARAEAVISASGPAAGRSVLLSTVQVAAAACQQQMVSVSNRIRGRQALLSSAFRGSAGNLASFRVEGVIK